MDERLTELPARELIERLATSDPIPGGGSAAAIAGAMGAALVQMVVALTTGRPAAADHEDALAEIGAMAATAQSDLLRLAEIDAAAYDAVVRARRLPRATDRERQAREVQVTAAIREATMAPLQTLRRADEVLGLAERLVGIANRNAISDVGVAALLAGTSVRGAALNVRINLPSLPDGDELRGDGARDVERALADLQRRVDAVDRQVVERMA